MRSMRGGFISRSLLMKGQCTTWSEKGNSFSFQTDAHKPLQWQGDGHSISVLKTSNQVL